MPVPSVMRMGLAPGKFGHLVYAFYISALKLNSETHIVFSLGECQLSENGSSPPDTGTVFSPSRIALKNNGKFWPQPGWEKRFSRACGGGNATGVEPSLGRKALILLYCR